MKKFDLSNIRIRDFKGEDYPGLINLWEETGMSDPERKDDLEIIEQTLEWGGKLWILETLDTGLMIGTAWITNNNRRLYVHHFCIKPEFQNKGLGYRLGLHCLEYARENKKQIKLEVHHSNQSAIHLYRKLGFTPLDGYEILIHRNP